MDNGFTQTIHLLKKNELILSVAESCTGGLIAKYFTDFPGSSVFFDSGFVTYSNESKINYLNVSAETLELNGAVSTEVVREMLNGLLKNSKINTCIAISGVAGPGGGTESKPVGTVYIGWVLKSFDSYIGKFNFSGDRESVREKASNKAIIGLFEYLNKIQIINK
jgi:nicotinamide-nucleotide amidase